MSFIDDRFIIDDCYIFKKNHEGKKEVYLDDYLRRFMKDNFNLEKLFS